MAYDGPRIRLHPIYCSIFAAQLALSATSPGIGAEQTSLGVIAGDGLGSEMALASDMAKLFANNSNLRVQPRAGDAGLANIARLANDKDADLAFVAADALAEAVAADATLTEHLDLVLRLAPQEVHVLARRDIKNLADLAGKTVNVGPAGGSAAITADYIFKALNISVEPMALDGEQALDALNRGSIAASVMVGAKPVPLIGTIAESANIHLVPIDFDAKLQDAYLPTNFAHDDYPNLVKDSAAVPTVATGLVLLAAKNDDSPRASRVTAFVDTLFSRFAELKSPGRHPKWRDVNLAAGLPGLKRNAAANTWLTGRPRSAPAKTEATAAAPPLPTGNEREALFKAFIDWQRAKGH